MTALTERNVETMFSTPLMSERGLPAAERTARPRALRATYTPSAGMTELRFHAPGSEARSETANLRESDRSPSSALSSRAIRVEIGTFAPWAAFPGVIPRASRAGHLPGADQDGRDHDDPRVQLAGGLAGARERLAEREQGPASSAAAAVWLPVAGP